jgi:pimeloyl-ACP methyl ester carboxylesterase
MPMSAMFEEPFMPVVASAPRQTVLCLHSSASSGRQWDAIAAALSPGHAVLAPPLLGYDGREPWPLEHAVTLDDEAAALEPLLDRACGPVHLIGHSYGGAVALQLALRRPAAVASLTLYEPVRFALLFGDRARASAGDDIVRVGRGIGALAAAGHTHAAALRFVDYWSGDGAWSALPRSRQDAVAARMTKVRAEFEALFGDAVAPSVYATLRMPVRVLRGDASPEPARAVAARLSALLPLATLVTLRGGVHMQPVVNPNSVIAALPYWLSAARAANENAPLALAC